MFFSLFHEKHIFQISESPLTYSKNRFISAVSAVMIRQFLVLPESYGNNFVAHLHVTMTAVNYPAA